MVPAPKCAAGRGVYRIRVPVSGWGMVTPVMRPGWAVSPRWAVLPAA
jgi:hypothetical protein